MGLLGVAGCFAYLTPVGHILNGLFWTAVGIIYWYGAICLGAAGVGASYKNHADQMHKPVVQCDTGKSFARISLEKTQRYILQTYRVSLIIKNRLMTLNSVLNTGNQ